MQVNDMNDICTKCGNETVSDDELSQAIQLCNECQLGNLSEMLVTWFGSRKYNLHEQIEG